ncbi:MAG: AIR synthase-related protein [Candidatus Bathyarchaeia archaeon]
MGLELSLSSVPVEGEMRDDVVLFSESNSRLLVEVPPRHQPSFEELMDGSVFARVGVVTGEERLTIRGHGGVVVLPLRELMAAWKTPLGGSA